MNGCGRVAVGVAFVARGVGDVGDTGEVQEAVDTCGTKPWAVAGGVFAVGGDRVGDIAIIEAVGQAPRTLHARSRRHTGLVSAAVWQNSRSATCVECE
jgi:hypothetical protein